MPITASEIFDYHEVLCKSEKGIPGYDTANYHGNGW
jgi:hypothetical protein